MGVVGFGNQSFCNFQGQRPVLGLRLPSTNLAWCVFVAGTRASSPKATCVLYVCANLQVTAEDASDAYTTVQFHPDGLILGTGTC